MATMSDQMVNGMSTCAACSLVFVQFGWAWKVFLLCVCGVWKSVFAKTAGADWCVYAGV